MTLNLNDLSIAGDGYTPAEALADLSARDANVTAYFRDLDRHLAARIAAAPMVVGCTAWLTSARVLTALAKRPLGASLLVQKEDFLRPDIEPRRGFRRRLRALYDAVPTLAYLRTDLHRPVSALSIASDPCIDPIRCVGVRNRGQNTPRMHHKFVVFCRPEHPSPQELGEPRPYAVWTGSFNPTINATRSFENAVYIESAHLAQRYFEEWAQLLALSEPLDWTSEYVAPEWRIGT